MLGLDRRRSSALDVSLLHLQRYVANLGASNMAGHSVLSNYEHRLTLLYNLIGLLLFFFIVISHVFFGLHQIIEA